MKHSCAHHLLVPSVLVFLCFASGCDEFGGTDTETSDNSTATPADDPEMTDPGMVDPAVGTAPDPNETPISKMIRENKEAVSKFTGDAKLVADRVIELDNAERLKRPKDSDGFGLQPPPAAPGTFHGMVVSDGKLEKIYLPERPVTDEDLALFSKISSLIELDLPFCQTLTDSGIDNLAKLTELKKLNLKYTNISQQKIDQLSESLPGCEIIFAPIPEQP